MKAPTTRISDSRRSASPREAGFTLAGLLAIMTVIMVFVAYTVPRQWSKVMQREREKQTIFVMKQYARAIREWSKKNGANPVKLDQLKEARLPRVMRGRDGELVNPLTGEMDWILIPPGAVTREGGGPGPTGGGMPGGPGNNNNRGGGNPATGTNPAAGTAPVGGKTTFNAGASPKDYVGPFIGVRPPNSGPSILTLNGAEDYSEWYYTTLDLELETAMATMPNPNARP